MLRQTVGQWRVFLVMLLSGAVSGLYYDALWAVRRRLEAGRWLTLLCDLAFGAGSAALFIVFSLRANWGQVRLYEMAAWAVGLSLYMAGPHPGVRWIARAAHQLLRRVPRLWFVEKIFR